MPKSATSACPPCSSTFSGLTSRCTTPRACAWSSASATSRASRTASPTGSALAREPRAQRLALDERHHVVQQPARAPRVEQRQDVRVLQRRGDADLREEPLGPHGRRELLVQHLDGDAAAVPQVAREVHGGHAAAPELALDRVAAGERLREPVGGRRGGGRRPERRGGRPLEEVGRDVVRGEERRDLAPQRGVVAARVRDERVAPRRVAGERGLEDRVHHAPPLGRHRRRARRPARVGSGGVRRRRHAASSRRSHMRATAHSRPTVAGETPSAAAASGC
jgi:hypothetical protein